MIGCLACQPASESLLSSWIVVHDDDKAAVIPLPSLLGPRAGMIFGEAKFQLPTVAQIARRKRSSEGVAIDKGPGNGR